MNWDKVIDLLHRGWGQGAMRRGNKLCFGAAMCYAANPQANLYGDRVPLPDEGSMEFVAHLIQEHYPQRVRVVGENAYDMVVGFNDHPDTTFEDVLLIAEKARASA